MDSCRPKNCSKYSKKIRRVFISKYPEKYSSIHTRVLGTCTRLYHQVLELDNFESCELVLEACAALDSSTDKHM